MLIQEAFVDLTENSRFGSDAPYEPYHQEPGPLFRDLRQEYGRCTGKVYLDTESRGVIAIGWVFVSRQRYTDCNDTYLREVWVTLYEECEHGDPHELTQVRGRQSIATGLKYHTIAA